MTGTERDPVVSSHARLRWFTAEPWWWRAIVGVPPGATPTPEEIADALASVGSGWPNVRWVRDALAPLGLVVLPLTLLQVRGTRDAPDVCVWSPNRWRPGPRAVAADVATFEELSPARFPVWLLPPTTRVRDLVAACRGGPLASGRSASIAAAPALPADDLRWVPVPLDQYLRPTSRLVQRGRVVEVTTVAVRRGW